MNKIMSLNFDLNKVMLLKIILCIFMLVVSFILAINAPEVE
jgi:hypothetical protein